MAGMNGLLNGLMANPYMLLLFALVIVCIFGFIFLFIGLAVLMVFLLPIFVPAILIIAGLAALFGKIPGLKNRNAILVGIALIILGGVWWYIF
jgi:hypothetical protein